MAAMTDTDQSDRPAARPPRVANLRLCDLPLGVRLGLLGIVATLLGGMAASIQHLQNHYAPRDGDKSSVSKIDLLGAYHGVVAEAPLIRALERGHPEDLTGEPLVADERDALLEWLRGDNIDRRFDDERLGEMMPAEILDRRCVSCHQRDPDNAAHPAPDIPLFYPDDVMKVAVSTDIQPVPKSILTMSTHAHALTLGVQSVVVVALALGTRLPRRIVSIAAAGLGLSLAVDIASWWLTRDVPAFLWGVIVGGGLFNGLMVVLLLAVGIDLLVPRTRVRPG